MTDVVKTRAIGGDGPARDVVATEKAEAEQDLWRASERRHHEKIRRKNRAAWFSYFCRMADNHAALAASYAERAERLCEEGAA